MRYLLDTHVLLWALQDSPQLSTIARTLIGDESNECLFSALSVAEIAIKHAKHPENMPISAEDARAAFIAAGFRELAFSARQAVALGSLPQNHKDPFDRMLIAQAKADGLKLLSHDDRVVSYGDCVIPV